MRVQNNEKGQAIVLIIVSVVIMVIMAALMIDGGNMYLNRRTAQTAADAAALRGAYEYCVNGISDPTSVVIEYATVQNEATAVELPITITADELTVTVSITQPTFFAKIFNRPTTTVRATASAACFSPEGLSNILPIAWSCRSPEGDEDNLGSGCTVQSIPKSIFEEITASGFNFDSYVLDVGDGTTANSYQNDIGGTANEGKLIYIIMDSNKFDLSTCEEPQWGTGNINCDLNDDGILDVDGRGDRGWLSFDGSMGANDLWEIITNGYSGEVTIDTWYSGAPGTKTKVFDMAKLRIGDIVLLPVYNAVCDKTNDPLNETACADVVQVGDQSAPTSGQKKFFRVSAFAPFVITCVSTGKNDQCPGKTYSGLQADKNFESEKTIEGYFIDGYVINSGTLGNPDFDLGVYILSLTN